MRKRLHTYLSTLALAAAAATMAAGCGSQAARDGRSPVYLVIEQIEVANGAEDQEFQSELYSDVETLIKKTVDGEEVFIKTYFNDPGRGTFRLAMKDIGAPGNPTAPTTNNAVTITRYRVTYRRADGRNTPGVDIPHAFEGATTVTVAGGSASTGFTAVRYQAKLEDPLIAMRGARGAIGIFAIADVTFYGRDQVGNDVQATGSFTVRFADWADPE